MTPPAWLAGLPWALPWFTLFRFARRGPDLLDYPAATGRSLSVIIPARNEAATIATVVNSILATTYRPVEIIVVDDRSTDTTAEIASDIAGHDARVRLVRGEELPAGWYGKPWACLQGYHAAGGELICFTDADTHHAPALLGHAVGALETEAADLVTVAPKQISLTFWERVVMPQIWALLGFRFHPRAVNRATRPRDVIANGQFILTTREAYEAIGTHAAVRDQVAEDLVLAQTYLRRGRKLFFAFAESLMETRMYTSLRHLVEGWTKNMILGGRRSFPDEPILRALVPLVLMLIMLFWLIPPIGLLLSLTGVISGWTVAAAVATGLSAVYWVVMAGGMNEPPLYGVLYPLGSAVVLFIAARATWRGGRRVEWRGRTYGLDHNHSP